jgi:hypothetical protein
MKNRLRLLANVAITLLVLASTASAIERLRGTIRRNGDVLCLYHCDDYYLDPDAGYQYVLLTGYELAPFVGLHVEVTGWQVACGSCPTLSLASLAFLSVTDVSSFSSIIPLQPALYQNYPNPFNPVTQIEFQVPSHSVVTLTIYNAMGERVATPVNESLSPGLHRVSWDASSLPSGVYHYILRAGQFTSSRSMVLVR